MLITDIHIADVKIGDTVIHDGEHKTVCRNNIRRDEFFGILLFGDSYNLGLKPVRMVTFTERLKDQTEN